jgi:peptide/nickel transport system ATP-binding protein
VTGPALAVEGVRHAYPLRGRVLGGVRGWVPSLVDVELTLAHGETLALVGESGSGKSTLARLLVGLLRPGGGRILFRRAPEAPPLDLARLRGRAWKAVRREIGLVPQDPKESLNPRQLVGAAVAEPLRVHGVARGRAADARAQELLARVGLDPGASSRFPHEFSDGQRQRVAIARALALSPRVLVLDEAVSALDASVRAQILNLLADLQAERGLAYLFVTHDLALARAFATRVAVLAGGRVVESGAVEEVLARPTHPATRRLVEALPSGDPRRRRVR